MKFELFSRRHGMFGHIGDQARPRRRSRIWALEGLEERALLSGPTVYTVDLATDSAPSTGGSGSGTTGDLRDCIGQANANSSAAGSVIQFAPTVFSASKPRTITLGVKLTLIESGGPELIDGPGAGVVTISGGETTEVFSVNAGVKASLSGLTIANGWGGGNAFIAGGAGGINNAGNLTVSHCSVLHDAGTSLGGVLNTGTMTILNSTVANSFANAFGLPYESAFGGGINNAGTLSIVSSTISGNSAYNGGGIYNSRSLSITDSTLSGNVAQFGGGIHNEHGTLWISNSTLATNGSQGEGSAIDNDGTLKSVNCTIAYNTGGGGGFYADSGTAILDNTIVALNNTLGLNQQGGTPLDICGHDLIVERIQFDWKRWVRGAQESQKRQRRWHRQTALGHFGRQRRPNRNHRALEGQPGPSRWQRRLGSQSRDQSTFDHRSAGLAAESGCDG